MPSAGELLVADDPASLAKLAARLFVGAAAEAALARGVARVALSGGSTPTAMFRELATMEVPWSHVEVFWVDERAVPPSSDRSNYGVAKEALFGRLARPPRGLYAMPGAAPDLDEAAKAYAGVLERSFGGPPGPLDLVLLGIGDDGHTASLFPGDATIDLVDRAVTAVPAAPGREARLTLTRPTLTAARRIFVLAQGASKREPIARARSEGSLAETPARIVREAAGDVVWLVDRAAVRA